MYGPQDSFLMGTIFHIDRGERSTVDYLQRLLKEQRSRPTGPYSL